MSTTLDLLGPTKDLPNVTATKAGPILDGHYLHLDLTNGTQISVVRHSGSCGGPQGLFEVALFEATGTVEDGGPFGWLTQEEVVAKVRAYAEAATPAIEEAK